MNRRVDALDGLRVFALVGIVVFHLFGESGLLTAGGDSFHERVIWTIFGNTLDFFFIISGFLLFIPVIRRDGDVGKISTFYLKRFSRLQPEYWACLLVTFMLIVLVPVSFQPPVPSAGNVLIHIFDLQTVTRLFDPGFTVGFWINGALWLVPVIAGLYLVFPLVARSFYRHIWIGLVVAALISVCWKLAPDQFPAFFRSLSDGTASDESVRIIALDQTPAYFFSFAAGMASAWVYTLARQNAGSPWVRRGVMAAFVIGIPAYVLVSIPFTHEALLSVTGFDGSSRGRGLALNSLASTTVRSVLVLGVILGPLWIQKPFANPFMKWMADRSYGIYLIHLPVIFYLQQLFDLPQNGTAGDMTLWLVVVLPIVTAYAWASRRLVGEPSIRAVNKWIDSRDSGVSEAPSRPSEAAKVRYWRR